MRLGKTGSGISCRSIFHPCAAPAKMLYGNYAKNKGRNLRSPIQINKTFRTINRLATSLSPPARRPHKLKAEMRNRASEPQHRGKNDGRQQSPFTFTRAKPNPEARNPKFTRTNPNQQASRRQFTRANPRPGIVEPNLHERTQITKGDSSHPVPPAREAH
jgi:hypothetical protein